MWWCDRLRQRTRLGRIRKGCYSPALARGFLVSRFFRTFEANGTDGRSTRQTAATPLLVYLDSASGCSQHSWFKSDEAPAVVGGVVSPTKRIEDLRELAQNATAKTPAERDQISLSVGPGYST